MSSVSGVRVGGGRRRVRRPRPVVVVVVVVVVAVPVTVPVAVPAVPVLVLVAVALVAFFPGEIAKGEERMLEVNGKETTASTIDASTHNLHGLAGRSVVLVAIGHARLATHGGAHASQALGAAQRACRRVCDRRPAGPVVVLHIFLVTRSNGEGVLQRRDDY